MGKRTVLKAAQRRFNATTNNDVAHSVVQNKYTLQAAIAKIQAAAAPHDCYQELIFLQHQIGNQALGKLLQAKVQPSAQQNLLQFPQQIQQLARQGTSGQVNKLPYLDKVQQAFGQYDITHVQAFTDEKAGEANHSMHARAYTMGNKIAFRDINPSLHIVAHEAAHVIQQQYARVKVPHGVGKVGDLYESQADQIANKVVQGEPVESLLSTMVMPGPAADTFGLAPTSENFAMSTLPISSNAVVQMLEDPTEEEPIKFDAQGLNTFYAGLSAFSQREEMWKGMEKEGMEQLDSIKKVPKKPVYRPKTVKALLRSKANGEQGKDNSKIVKAMGDAEYFFLTGSAPKSGGYLYNGGHLIASRFLYFESNKKFADTYENLIPMETTLNNGAYKTEVESFLESPFEKEEARLMTVDLTYDNNEYEHPYLKGTMLPTRIPDKIKVCVKAGSIVDGDFVQDKTIVEKNYVQNRLKEDMNNYAKNREEEDGLQSKIEGLELENSDFKERVAVLEERAETLANENISIINKMQDYETVKNDNIETRLKLAETESSRDELRTKLDMEVNEKNRLKTELENLLKKFETLEGKDSIVYADSLEARIDDLEIEVFEFRQENQEIIQENLYLIAENIELLGSDTESDRESDSDSESNGDRDRKKRKRKKSDSEKSDQQRKRKNADSGNK
jgi:hypothetical protein